VQGTRHKNSLLRGRALAMTFRSGARSVLDSAPEYAGAILIDGFFEREVELGTVGRNSQTDLMVVSGLGSELGIIAVEGKAEESPLRNVYLNGTTHRENSAG
jgi:hypothetical protein